MRHEPARFTGGGAVNGAEERNLRLGPIPAEPLCCYACVKVLVACGLGHFCVLGERYKDAGFQLGGIGDDELVARVRTDCGPDISGNLQGTSAA
ncbi:hypothetical protein StoSoilB13_21750 [Arthrobacter sp. StoSoilB13]|nr:hypothetical protein StoSoilB13_21750 [Arthrobacter sp. StoSoilB13]